MPANKPDWWTPERNAEHGHRLAADKLCKKGLFEEAQRYCLKHNIAYPPFKKSPTRFDGRSLTSATNGAKGGAPPGNNNGTGNTNKVTVDPEILVEAMAQNILAGGTAKIKTSPLLGPVTKADRASLTRIANMSVEELNVKLGEKMGVLLELLVDSLTKDVRQDKLKPGEKAFAMAVTSDKRNTLTGQSQINGATVNLQVNNFNGPVSREELMKRLSPTKPAEPTPPVAPDDIDLPPA